MNEEYSALMEHYVWDAFPQPSSRKVVHSTWHKVYKLGPPEKSLLHVQVRSQRVLTGKRNPLPESRLWGIQIRVPSHLVHPITSIAAKNWNTK